MGANSALISLLVLTVITVVKGQTQYYDILQGLQQLFQPYQNNDFNVNQYNGVTRAPTHKQENKKKTIEQRHQTDDRRTKKPPTNQFEYVFATTEKPTRKTAKPNSSQNNSRSFNSKNEYSNVLLGEYYNPYEITTKSNRNRPKTTTTTTASSYFNYPNRGTTQNVFGNNFNIARPVTDNVFENVNIRETFADNNPPRPANLVDNGGSIDFNNNFSGNTNNRHQNDRNRGGSNVNSRGTLNTDYNINFPSLPSNNRQNGFLNTDNNPGFNFGGNIGGNDFNRANNFDNAAVNFNNRETSNFNSNDRVISNSNSNIGSSSFNTNTNRPANNFNNNNNYNPSGFYYPSDSSIINQPGVVPAPVNVNQPPITNRPVTNNNNFGSFNRPLDPSSVTFVDQSDPEPEILIGPDEDDMSEWQKRRYEDAAERMCDYYRSLTVRKVVALPLLPTPDGREFNVSDCTPINVPLIIGGTIANIRDFPHMAIVGWMKVQEAGYSWKCGGSLISDRYVLTAGHCTYQDKDANVLRMNVTQEYPSGLPLNELVLQIVIAAPDGYSWVTFILGPPQAVQLGSSYLDDPGALIVKISAVIRHPKYKQRRSYHDVALIKMVSKVKFSEVIRPACLGVPPPEGRSIIATGWGRTEYGGDHSLQLRSVSLSVWNMQECKDIWGTSLKLPNGVTTDSHMCAGERAGGKDTCQGDSGGPAQIQDGCLWRVVAVTSYGRSCGAPDTPALYAVIPHAFVAAQVFNDRS